MPDPEVHCFALRMSVPLHYLLGRFFWAGEFFSNTRLFALSWSFLPRSVVPSPNVLGLFDIFAICRFDQLNGVREAIKRRRLTLWNIYFWET